MTFLTDMVEKGYTQEEVFAVLFESEQDKKRRQMLATVTKTVDAHHLQKMGDILTFEKLATFRKMKGFNRAMDGEDNWFHTRSLPPTPQEFCASLRFELQKLKDAISMPRQKVSNPINEIEEGKVGDEEFARLKWLVEKPSRESAQAQVTVTPVDTVQYCSLSPRTPEPCQVYVSSWRTTRVIWTRSEASSNHHRLVRVLKHPDSSVPRTRGRGMKDEPTSTAS